MSSIRASGSFEVTMSPEPPFDTSDGISLGRVTLDKKFSGDLEATSRGQMLAARTAVPASAGYVAIERVSGVLQGKAGTFVVQHSGIMNRGVASLTCTVVPDSGTGALAGLSGVLRISIVDGKHYYELDYALA